MAVPIAVALVAPWLVHLVSSFRFEAATGSPTASTLLPPFYYSYARISYIESVPTTPWLLFLTGVGFLLAVFRRRMELVFLLAWTGIQLAFSNPYIVSVPWSGVVDFVTVLSILFIPASIVAAYALSSNGNPHGTPEVSIGRIVVDARALYAILLMLVVLVGAAQTAGIHRPQSIFLSPADVRAFEWIQSRTPPGSTFLTSMQSSKVDLVEPTDGGVWITYFTGRRQTAPPLIYRIERASAVAYEAELQELVALQRRIGDRESFERLSAWGITHIYLGTRGSKVMNSRKLRAAPWYELVYEAEGVEIYEVQSSDPLS